MPGRIVTFCADASPAGCVCAARIPKDTGSTTNRRNLNRIFSFDFTLPLLSERGRREFRGWYLALEPPGTAHVMCRLVDANRLAPSNGAPVSGSISQIRSA